MKLIAAHAIFYEAKPNERKNQSQLETPGLPGWIWNQRRRERLCDKLGYLNVFLNV